MLARFLIIILVSNVILAQVQVRVFRAPIGEDEVRVWKFLKAGPLVNSRMLMGEYIQTFLFCRNVFFSLSILYRYNLHPRCTFEDVLEVALSDRVPHWETFNRPHAIIHFGKHTIPGVWKWNKKKKMYLDETSPFTPTIANLLMRTLWRNNKWPVLSDIFLIFDEQRWMDSAIDDKSQYFNHYEVQNIPKE